jgi:hypothetical protein
MAVKLPPLPIGLAPGSSYWNDWYEKLRTYVDQITTSVDWSIIINKPTTLTGYGITTTGTGIAVQQNSPSLITPDIGAATATSVNSAAYSVSGTPGISVVITTAKLTVAGANGSMTFNNGILTAQTQAT